MDADKLLITLNENQPISKEEINWVVEFLNNEATHAGSSDTSIDDIYSFIIVAIRAKLTQTVNALEKLLELQDPLTAALILETLCLNWDLIEDYLEIVCNFALGVSWDSDEDVRHTAIKILGEYLHKQSENIQALELLFSIFDDRDNDSWTRRAACCALLRASGVELNSLPSESSQLAFDSEEIKKPLNTLRKKLGDQSSNSSLPSESPAELFGKAAS